MTSRPRIVIDNNALVSRLLLPSSVPARAVRKAVETAQILVTDATLMELAEVLSRPKFDPYVSVGERQEFLRLLTRVGEMVVVTLKVKVCRDPKDDAVLEAAVNGRANLIVTGDKDLLTLHEFHRIPVLSPSAYLRREE